MTVWLVCEVDYELHRVLAAFSDRVRAATFKDLLDERMADDALSEIAIESHEVDPPRDRLPGQYIAWVNLDGTLDECRFFLWDRKTEPGITMSDGSGRGHGDTADEAIENARQFIRLKMSAEGVE